MKLKPRKFNLRLTLILLAVTAVAGAGIYFIVARSNSADPTGNGAMGGMGGMGPGGEKRPQPVAASEVTVKDVPIWINAIGTMIPKNLVTVRSRTDGDLLKLHFTEGQIV